MKKIFRYLLISTCATLFVACRSDIPTANTPEALSVSPTPAVFERQPIPVLPIANGKISGLLNSEDIITVNVYDVAGNQPISGTFPGNNGPFELSLAGLSESTTYKIVMEADGYSVEPESYRIQIEGGVIYMMENGQRAEELQSLDFNFKSLGTSSPPL